MLKIFHLLKIMKCANTSHRTTSESFEYDQLPDETNTEFENKYVYFATHFSCTAIRTSCSFSFHPETDLRVEILKNQIVTLETQTKMYLVLNLDQFTSLTNLLSRLQTFESQFFIGYVKNVHPFTQTVDNMTQFYSSFTNLPIIKDYQKEQYKQMCTDFIFVKIPRCSFKVYNRLCKLHIIYRDYTFLDYKGMKYFCVYDANGNIRGSLSILKLKEILQTLKTHTLVTETQFNAFKSMDLEKTIHFYKTVVKVEKEKEKTILERIKSFFVEDPKKKAFLESRTYFADSNRMNKQQFKTLESEPRPSTSGEFIIQTTAKKRKGKKEKTTTALMSESEDKTENVAQLFDD